MAYYRKRLSPIKPSDPIDYKDVELLRKFITERGKILPRRITALTSSYNFFLVYLEVSTLLKN